MTFSGVRNLRIIEWQGGRPVRAECTRCERVFTLDDYGIIGVAEARDNLESQFWHHLCRDAGPTQEIALAFLVLRVYALVLDESARWDLSCSGLPSLRVLNYVHRQFDAGPDANLVKDPS